MSSMGPSGSGAHGFQLNSAGIRRHHYTPSHQTQPSKPSPAPHNASPYQPQYQTHGSYGPGLFPQVNGNVPNGNSRGPGPHAHNALGQQRQRPAPPGRQQQMPQPQQPNPPMMFGPMSQSVPHDSIMAHQHQQQQHQGHSSHHGHPGQQHQPHQAHQQHQGLQHSSHHPQQQQQQQQQHAQQQPQTNQQQQSHMQRQQQQQQQQLQHQHHAQQQQQHQVTPPQHIAHQPPPHQQPHHHQQQPTPQHQHRQQPQSQMPHQQPKQSLQQPPQPPQQQPPQPQPQLPQAQAQTQLPPQIQLQQPQPSQSKAGRNHTPQQKAPQPPTPQPPPQPVQPQVTPQVQKDVDVMDIDGSREGDSEMPGLDSQILQDPSFQPSQPMGEMMSPPPEGGSYPTLEAVQKAVLRYCTSVGYAIVIGRSKKTVPGLKKVLFVCDRAGKPPNRVSPEHRKRKTSSRKCDCPFGFFAIEQRTQWTIRYRPDKQHLHHNHGPSESPSHHPAARKLDSKMVAAVKQLKENGAGVSETLQILQNENPDCHLLPRDIYNARAAINRNPPKPQTTPGEVEESPTIYTKQPQTNEDKIRSELRSQLSKAREDLKKIEEEKNKEIDSLKDTIKEKDKMISKFEMFIDICNQRVMVQRERLSGPGEDGNGPAAARNQS